MEHAPREQTPEQIEHQVTILEQEILDLEKRLVRTHQESGSNSAEDNAQEGNQDLQDRDIIASQISDKRKEMVRLQDLLPQKAA